MSQMNSKKFLYNTAVSVQPLYVAGHLKRGACLIYSSSFKHLLVDNIKNIDTSLPVILLLQRKVLYTNYN